jgi:cell division protein ZapA (FtsZ GTPase activity inhibitor)
MKDTKSYKVIIFGDEYSLVTDENEETILQSAAHVDALMRSIAERARTQEIRRIAVLAALRLASTLHALEKKQETLKDIEKNLLELIDRELSSSLYST